VAQLVLRQKGWPSTMLIRMDFLQSIGLDKKMYFEKRSDEFCKQGLSESALPQLKRYVDLLWASNQELNLVSRKMTFAELIDNHVMDCLLPLSYFPKALFQVADLGSGSGLPGVVYAIQFPQLTFHLFEKSKLKQDFLLKCQMIAPNLQVHGEIPLDLKDIDLVVARAFKPLDVLLEMTRIYYQNGGKYFLLKGRREKIEEELLLARKRFSRLQPSIEVLTSPVLEVERHLVLI
jgi:16S rRNA (guanine527-N7)-methyltransferase